MIVTMYV
jgi:hypothetical protein